VGTGYDVLEDCVELHSDNFPSVIVSGSCSDACTIMTPHLPISVKFGPHAKGSLVRMGRLNRILPIFQTVQLLVENL